MAFEALGLGGWAAKQCKTLGLKEPTPVQANCIPHIIKGRDVLGYAKTGSGKTVPPSPPAPCARRRPPTATAHRPPLRSRCCTCWARTRSASSRSFSPPHVSWLCRLLSSLRGSVGGGGWCMPRARGRASSSGAAQVAPSACGWRRWRVAIFCASRAPPFLIISSGTVVQVGGLDQVQQGLELSRRPHIVVGTPGRLADFVVNSGLSLGRVKFLVLDEVRA